MSATPCVAAVGSINMDLAVSTPRVPRRGENLLAHGLVVGLGGKGANSAVALARMGAHSLLVGCVGGDDWGRRALELLGQEKVDLEGVRAIEGVPTGVALIMVDDEGENTILVVNGANDELTPAAVEVALAAQWQHIDALLVNFEIPSETVAETVRLGAAHGVPVVVDAGPPRCHGPEVWGAATILSPNSHEVEVLVGYRVETHAAMRQAARELLAHGPKAVVIKCGAEGALVCTAQGEELVQGFRVPVIDTTGAGDAFTAGLTLALAEGKILLEAVRFANAAGAQAVTRMGTMDAMPSRDQVEALLSRQAR